jgi:CheY-like chemotaxis protein
MGSEFHILLVDDSRADAKIIERALNDGNVSHRLTVLLDGSEALDYLNRLVEPDAPQDDQPDLVLLDLNLPGLDGHEVLTRIKKHPVLRAIPVVVLSTSQRDEDVIQTYRAGANTFIPKPAEYVRYRELVKTLHHYWQETALRPPPHRPEQ